MPEEFSVAASELSILRINRPCTLFQKNPFIRQLKINYLATYATILNNNTTKATEQDK